MKCTVKLFSASLLLVFFVSTVTAQTFNSTTGGGNWNAGGSWVGGTAPANWANHTANVFGNMTVNVASIASYTAISVNDGRTLARGTAMVPADLEFQNVTNINVVNGNITVFGNLTLNNTTLTITTGTLTVTGTLTLTNGAVVNYNSTATSSIGSFTTAGSGGTMNVNNGRINTSGVLTVNSGGTFRTGSSGQASAGSVVISNSSSAQLLNSGQFTVSGNVTQGGVLTNNGTLQVGGNLTSSGSGSSITTNNGQLNLTGSLSMPSSGRLQVNPGGVTVIDGHANLSDNENIVVGTSVAPPPFADLVIRGNLQSTGSGDVRVNRNGRLAVFGNITATGGGTFFTIENGAQAYVHGNINFSGGGSQIVNNNSTNPYGLYVNGTISNSGGGSATTGNLGNQATMQNTNPGFFGWVASHPGSPLPVTLLFFRIQSKTLEFIALEWATGSELNFDYFSLERSANGTDFREIARIPGYGTTTLRQNYSFVDENPVIGINYYRLTSVDVDDFREVFRAVAIVFEGERKAQIFPNPIRDQLNIHLNFDPGPSAAARITDLQGQLIWQAPIGSQNSFELPLRPGVYILQLSADGLIRTERVVVD